MESFGMAAFTAMVVRGRRPLRRLNCKNERKDYSHNANTRSIWAEIFFNSERAPPLTSAATQPW